MKADWNDAPGHLKRPRKRGAAKLIPGLIGILITLALLQMASSAFLKGTVQGIVDKRTQPKPAPIAEIRRAEPTATKDWDRVVEEVAARDAMPKTAQSQVDTQRPPPNKQTVFTDANYVPRGADNVVSSFKEPLQPIRLPSPTAKKEITVVGQKPSKKDSTCWPFKEGSLERRRCRASVGLNNRD